jgi:hypothetical protein
MMLDPIDRREEIADAFLGGLTAIQGGIVTDHELDSGAKAAANSFRRIASMSAYMSENQYFIAGS